MIYFGEAAFEINERKKKNRKIGLLFISELKFPKVESTFFKRRLLAIRIIRQIIPIWQMG
jgi:hypothetical protein